MPPDATGFTVYDTPPDKPTLLLQSTDPDVTVAALRDILATAGTMFDRGQPVRLAYDQAQGGSIAQVVTPELLILEAHRVCRPQERRTKREATITVNARVPRNIAITYLDWRGEWRLKPLHGIASAPLLHADGSIRCQTGYDDATGMWCENVPDVSSTVPRRPSKGQAEAALCLIRRAFSTFPFADAPMVHDPGQGVPVVDVSQSPQADESAFLAALLTAVCRPSLHLAPGVLLRAAPMSGAGAGKGLLARCICLVAFGREPHAFTGGIKQEELEKRISAELIEGAPALFLDNLNSTAFRSDLLASAITERPARVRLLGKSEMAHLCANTMIILAGNGLSVSEDLARRFIAVELDPRTEDPESRPFRGDIRTDVKGRRSELLSACLTIWRWGRLASGLPAGKPLGSFAQWCKWVRDPLLALGCRDTADRISEAKARDGRRQLVAELFAVWWQVHRDDPVKARDLADDVRRIIDPHDRGRQHVSAALERMAGTRMAGFLLTRHTAGGKWSGATYVLSQHVRNDPPMTPMTPMPYQVAAKSDDEIEL